MDQSETVQSVSSNYKIKLKYGGYFRLSKNLSGKRYCFGYPKSVYINKSKYDLEDLIEEVTNCYPSNRGLVFSIWFADKSAMGHSFIKLVSNEVLDLMFRMDEMEKELTVFVTTNDNNDTNSIQQRDQNEITEVIEEPNGEEESEYSLSDEDYHSQYSSDSEVGDYLNNESYEEEETHSQTKKTPNMNLNSKFSNVIEFRRALITCAIVNEFEYFIEKSDPTQYTAISTNKECKWRIHASVMQDGVTFQVKTFIDTHSCTRSNKGGNKLASQGWIASVVSCWYIMYNAGSWSKTRGSGWLCSSFEESKIGSHNRRMWVVTYGGYELVCFGY